MVTNNFVVDSSKQQQRLLEEQKQGGVSGFFFDEGKYNPFIGDDDCYGSLDYCAKDFYADYDMSLNCQWDHDHEYCRSSICVPKSSSIVAAATSGGDNNEEDDQATAEQQQQEVVVCSTAMIVYNDPGYHICSSTFVQTTTAKKNWYGSSTAATTTMEHTFCFFIEEDHNECRFVSFETRDDRGNACIDWLWFCSACESDDDDDDDYSGRPTYTNYQEIMKRGGNLTDYGIAIQEPDFFPRAWRCFSDYEIPYKQRESEEQLVEWADPFNRIEQILPKHSPSMKPGYNVYAIFSSIPVVVVLVSFWLWFISRHLGRRGKQHEKLATTAGFSRVSVVEIP